MGQEYSNEKFTEVPHEFAPITKPIDDGQPNKTYDQMICENTGDTVTAFNNLRQQTTEQVPSYDLQLSFPQVEETFKLEQLQSSGMYLGNSDVNMMQAANRQESAIQQRMFQNSRQEGINYLVSPDYQCIKMVTDNSNVAHSPNYYAAIRDGVVQQEDEVVDLPYQLNNPADITPYKKNPVLTQGLDLQNMTDNQKQFIQYYISQATSCKAIRELNKQQAYKDLPYWTKFKLDCYVKKQLYK